MVRDSSWTDGPNSCNYTEVLPVVFTMVQTSRQTLLLLGLFLTFAFVGILLMLRSYYNEFYTSGRPIHFVVPDGFRGKIKFIRDFRGLAIDPETNLIVFQIPDSGVLRVKSLKPFRKRHTLTASFANGDPIPDVITGVLPNSVALRPASGFYCVGTFDECYSGGVTVIQQSNLKSPADDGTKTRSLD